MKFYRRSGQRVSKEKVTKARAAYAEGKRTGKLGHLKCAVNHEEAARIEAMSLMEFCRWSGAFTYKP